MVGQGVMPPGKSRRRAKQRRCRHCGRFIRKSDVKLCPSCLAAASVDDKPKPDTSDAKLSGSATTEFGRTLTDLGLDVRFLSQNQISSDLSKQFPDRAAVMQQESTPSRPQSPLHPSLQNLRDSLLRRARHDSVIARTTELRARPMRPGAGAPKSVLSSIGPVAAARRARDQTRGRGARQNRADARGTAPPIAIGVAVMCVGAAVGAAIPFLLFVLGP